MNGGPVICNRLRICPCSHENLWKTLKRFFASRVTKVQINATTEETPGQKKGHTRLNKRRLNRETAFVADIGPEIGAHGGDDCGTLFLALEKITAELLREGWSEAKYDPLGQRPPLRYDHGHRSPTRGSLLEQLEYFEEQKRHLLSSVRRRRCALERRASYLMHEKQERQRRVLRTMPAYDTLKLECRSASRFRLNNGLNRFRRTVNGKHPDGGLKRNEGFPPSDALFLGTIAPFFRQLWVFNARDDNGYTREAVLLIYHPPTGERLYLNAVEFATLMNIQPALVEDKQRMEEKMKKSFAKPLMDAHTNISKKK